MSNNTTLLIVLAFYVISVCLGIHCGAKGVDPTPYDLKPNHLYRAKLVDGEIILLHSVQCKDTSHKLVSNIPTLNDLEIR